MKHSALAFEGVTPPQAARTSKRDVPTNLNTFLSGESITVKGASDHVLTKKRMHNGRVWIRDARLRLRAVFGLSRPPGDARARREGTELVCRSTRPDTLP